MNQLFQLHAIRQILILIFFGLMGLSCQHSRESGHPDWPNRHTLLQNGWKSGQKPLLVYGTRLPDGGAQYRNWAEALTSGNTWMQWEIQPDQAVSLSEIMQRPVYLVGTRASNTLVEALANRLPFVLADHHFVINGAIYADSSHVLTLRYPNPVAPQMPLYLVTGNTDSAILAHRSLDIRGDYQVFQHQKALVFGLFAQSEVRRWAFDPFQFHTFNFPSTPTIETEHYRFYASDPHIERERIRQLAAKHEATYQKISQWLSRPLPAVKIDEYLYESLEQKGLATGETACGAAQNYVTDRKQHERLDVDVNALVKVLSVNIDVLNCNNGYAEAGEWLRATLGKPQWAALETGLQVLLADDWHGQPVKQTLKRLFDADALPPLSPSDDSGSLSPALYPLVAASWVSFLLDTWGKEVFLERYYSTAITDINKLESQWRVYWTNQPAAPALHTDTRMLPFMKGFNFAHEGYQIYDGYGSENARQSLRKLHTLGSNAIAVIPYTYMPSPLRPSVLRFSHNAGEETDEMMLMSVRHAQEMGMYVLLKPQIWIRNAWPGDVKMQTAADWALFFAHYEQWILHYAVLAEWYQIPMLCVATELGKATKGHEAAWIALFNKVRKVYGGKLTVAANWDGGFEHEEFWQALDFIGINHYQSLSNQEDATDAQLLRGAQSSAAHYQALSRRYQRPIVFTEAGFTATKAPWIQPWAYADGKSVELSDQKRGYEALLKAWENQSWLGGYFWWKWPSYLEYGGLSDPDYTPNDKPAEAVIRRYFQK